MSGTFHRVPYYLHRYTNSKILAQDTRYRFFYENIDNNWRTNLQKSLSKHKKKEILNLLLNLLLIEPGNISTTYLSNLN